MQCRISASGREAASSISRGRIACSGSVGSALDSVTEVQEGAWAPLAEGAISLRPLPKLSIFTIILPTRIAH